MDLFEEIGMDELLRSARVFLCSLGLLVCTFANAGSVSAQSVPPRYTVTDLRMFQSSAMNNRGQIVGSRTDASGRATAVLWQDGRLTDLGALPIGGTWSGAAAINDRGDFIFNSYIDGEPHAFVWQAGQVTDLGIGVRTSYATAMNNNGQVVGRAAMSDGFSHAVLWQAGRMTDLGVDGYPQKINDRGQVIIGESLWEDGSLTSLLPTGTFRVVNQVVDLNDLGEAVIAAFVPPQGISTFEWPAHAFLWQKGRFTDLGGIPVGGRHNALQLAINNRSQVVGTLGSFVNQQFHAFMWQEGRFTVLGGNGTVVRAINNRGQVHGYDASGHPVLWDAGQMLDLGALAGQPVNFVGNFNDLGQLIVYDNSGPMLLQPVDRSLHLDGTTGYAESPNSSDLNITGDWTIEAWFEDEDPNGFNHDFRQILMKGDRNATGEAPYYVLVGRNSILAGVRTGGQDYPITWDLNYARLDPKVWHHVAVTFRADLNVLNLWLDGQHIRYLSVPTHSTAGNSLPLEIGRNGPLTGKYWLGGLDDVRIWNVARTGADISANFKTQLNGQRGLVANWHFDETSGATAVDSTGNHHDAALGGGAGLAADVHP